MLLSAWLERDRGFAHEAYLACRFVDGSDWNVELRDCCICYGAGDSRMFSDECVRLYSVLYEDHLMQAQLRMGRRTLDQLIQVYADPALIEDAAREYREFERHVVQHHRVPREYYFGSGEVYGSTFAAPPPEPTTLTVEMLERTHETMRDLAPPRLPRGFRFGDFGDLGPGKASTAAHDRAMALLKSNLTPAQLAKYARDRSFEVIGSDSGKRYRIRCGRQMNIDELDSEGMKVCGWCFLPQGGLVEGDVMLAQKIALECDETNALKVANRFEYHRPSLNAYLYSDELSDLLRSQISPPSGMRTYIVAVDAAQTSIKPEAATT
jgi:hypothetical protein